ncbi:tail tape measure protein H, partial [Escherichia coli 5905]
ITSCQSRKRPGRLKTSFAGAGWQA